MGKKVKLDFTGVESFQRASEGLHVCKIASAEIKQSQGGNDMIVVVYEVIKGDDKGSRVYENYPLVETALWKLKGMLQAIGTKADGKVQIDLDKLIGKVLQVNVFHEEYEGQIRAKVESVMKLSTATSDEEDDDDEDYEDEEEEEEAKPVKKAAKKAPMNKPQPEDDDEDDDWDDEDDEEPEEKPAPKKSAPKPTKKPAKKSESDDDDWDDDDWDED